MLYVFYFVIFLIFLIICTDSKERCLATGEGLRRDAGYKIVKNLDKKKDCFFFVEKKRIVKKQIKIKKKKE